MDTTDPVRSEPSPADAGRVMARHTVTFEGLSEGVRVPTGALVVEAARQAGLSINQPCGGQGRCGRCIVRVLEGQVRSRSTLRLTPEDLEQNFTLACQAVIEGDAHILVPPKEEIARRLTSDRTAKKISVPEGYDPRRVQTLRRTPLTLRPPQLEDQTDDWSRLQAELRRRLDPEVVDAASLPLRASLSLLRDVSDVLRSAEWQVTAVLETGTWDREQSPRLIDLIPGHVPEDAPLWGLAVDIGTTTVTVWLVDLLTGNVEAQMAEYNRQVDRGEDVISRIIFAGKNGGGPELRDLVLGTINELIETACKRVQTTPDTIYKVSVAGNSTMIHLLLGLPATSIRLSPFVTAVNHLPSMTAREVGLDVYPDATVDCLPGVASYVGADITAGVFAAGVERTERVTLFMDVGTNGEIVLGTRDWLATCAASAGPAFEGAGVEDGMRATRGAVEEVWIDGASYEPSIRVIGGTKARGLCGSGLISLLAEMFLTGVVDKAGQINLQLETSRVRAGPHGPEYVVVWEDQTAHGRPIAINNVDVDNLLRAKAAIYAGFTVLAEGVGLRLDDVEQVLIGGAFGQYINVEKAVEIGLLPDMPWERFHFLGNTAVRGAYHALLDSHARRRIQEIASGMTYVELSADNTFYDAFMSALFLPHTDESRFPSVTAGVGREG